MRINREFFKSDVFLMIMKIVIGILLIAFSSLFVDIASIVLGIILIIMGTVEIIDYFNYIRHKTPGMYFLIKPIIMVIVGLLFVFVQGFFASIISFMIGVFLFITGLVKFLSYIRIQSNRTIWWWVTIVVSVILMIIGLVFFFYPKDSMNTILVLCGIGILINSLQDISDKLNKTGYKFFKK